MIVHKGNKLSAGFTATIAALVILAGCAGRSGSSLRRHDLFSIPLGTLPGELEWFYREGFRIAGTADLHSRDGLIYVAGGETGKVMVFNSYGDLITFVYDPSRNAAPAQIEDQERGGGVSQWPFRNPRSIAAYNDGFLIDDGLQNERRAADSEDGVLYERVVLRFDREGNYLGHLGREGLGGSPFPFISSIDVREDGSTVVTCRIPNAWMSYWYDDSGYPIATVRIREDQLPGLEEGGSATVYSVRPDPVDWTLHLRMDLYPDAQSGKAPEPRLYTLDLTTLLYGEPIVLAYAEGNPKAGTPPVPPDYLGTTLSGIHVMLAAEAPDQYRILLVNDAGRVVQNRRLNVDPDATVYRRFRLQNDGLLAGIFFSPREASVVWWRIDKLIGKDG